MVFNFFSHSSTLRQASLILSVLSVMWVLCSAIHRKDIFWYPTPTLVQSEERIEEMYFWFTAEQRDFETHITDQTLLSVLAVRMWSYSTLILTKCKSLTVPLTPVSIYTFILCDHKGVALKLCCTICAMTVTDFCLILMALFMLINQLLMLSYKPVNHSFPVRQFFYPPLLWHLAICFIHKKTNLIDCIATFEKELNNICVCR